MSFSQKFKILISSLLLLIISACGEGCIHPEDFGGYDTQIVNVSAAGSFSESCRWDPEKLSDADISNSSNYGDGINDILSSSGLSLLVSLGCAYVDGENTQRYNESGFDENNRATCLLEVENLCKNRSLIAAPSDNNPWEFTQTENQDPVAGIKLSRNSKIFIKAQGDIAFAPNEDPIIAFYGGDYNYLSSIGHSYNFASGNLTNHDFSVESGSVSPITISGAIEGSAGTPINSASDWSMEAHNGLSRLYSYIKEYPSGYDLNDYPIEPDPRLWNCLNAGTDGKTFTPNILLGEGEKTNCYAENYAQEGYYPDLNRRIINNDVIIDESGQSLISEITTNGTNIHIEKYNTEYDIINPQNLGKYGGAILSNSPADQEIINPVTENGLTYTADPEKYRLIEYNSSRCQYVIENSDNEAIDVNNIDTEKLILPPNYSATFLNQDSETCAASDVNSKYIKTVTFEKSGYVRFFNTINACNIDIAVINQKLNGEIIYEAYGDNIKSINITAKPSEDGSIRSFLHATTPDLSNLTYVREGQILTFLPESWKWIDSNGCDINTLMHIEHRPAIICDEVDIKNDGSNRAVNMNCAHIIRCPEDNPDCSNDDLVRSCTEDGDVQPMIPDPQDESALRINQCFDVANYKGRLSEIDLDDNNEGVSMISFFDGQKGNFTTTYNPSNINNHLSFTNIKSANGRYNLSSNDAVQFGKTGNLKFLFLNDINHLELRLGNNANNYIASVDDDSIGEYNGSNGFSIKLGLNQSYSNGQNLQAVICSADNRPSRCNESIASGDMGEKIIIQDEVNNYAFTNSGIMKDISASPARDYYMHSGFGRNIDDDEKLLLAFNIYNPNLDQSSVNDCMIGGGEDCNVTSGCGTEGEQPCCNGKKVDNPHYQERYCPVGSYRQMVGGELKCCGVSSVESDDSEQATTCEGGGEDMIASSSEAICSNFSPNCYDGKICAGPNFGSHGSYKVIVRIENPDGPDSLSIIANIIYPILNFLDGEDGSGSGGFIERSYKNIVQNNVFVNMVQLFAVLFLTFYAISYFMGLSEMNQSEILKMVLKIGIIYLLISPNSWYWYKIFFVDTFKNGVNYIIFLMSVTFDRDPEILSAINNYDFSNKTLLFKSSDRIFRLLFDDVMHKKILGLIFNNLFGIIYVLVIYYAILIYLRAFFTSISFFLIAYTQMSIMLIFGPIFILFIFFSRTERLFKNWYENLISFSLQMIFLSLFLSFFNSIIYELIKMNFNYMVCWGTVWSIPIIDIGSIFEFWSLPSTGMGLNPNNSIVSDAPKLLSIILLYFVCKAMLDFIDYGSALSAKIAGNLRIGGQAMELGGAPIESIKITAGQAKSYLMKKTGAGEYLAERKDMFLDKHFDSGKIADKRHNLQKRDNAKVRKKELSIRSAGDMADRQYLKDHNIKDTRTLTKEQKLSMQNRRDKAMSQKAEDMGIDLDTKDGQEEFKSLKEARGNKMTDREKNSLTHLATSKLKEKYSKLSTYDAERTIPVANARSAEQSKYYNRQENDSDKGDKSKAGADIGLGSGGKPAAEGGIGLGSGGKSAAEGGIGLGGEADKAPPESGDKDVAKGPALDADKDSASASVSEDSALPYRNLQL